jgi:hypothetical protein
MKTQALVTSALALLAALTTWVGCGSDEGSGDDTNGNGAGAANGSGNGGAGASLGLDGLTGSGGGASTNGAGEFTGDVCAGELMQGEFVPLDIFIMLDKSRSMAEPTGTGTSKWASITAALEAFIEDDASTGIGVGLHFFPPNRSCEGDGECEAGSWCHYSVCDGDAAIPACQTNADCSGECVALGDCGANNCVNIGEVCDASGTRCTLPARSVCVMAEGELCNVQRYAAPSLPISELPDSAPDLLRTMGAHFPTPLPFGRTPMAPALEGAIEYAHSYAQQTPGHKVVAVLATDGKPTLCDPLDEQGVASIAAAGLQNRPGIETHTIGVFSPGDEGPDTVERIAEEGAGQAFIVDNTRDVGAQFLSALNEIRELGSCQFLVPSSGDLDYGKVNVKYTLGDDEPTLFPYVGDDGGCTSEGGWYYDVADATAETPKRIILCPHTCELQAEGDGTVAIEIGCRTVVR